MGSLQQFYINGEWVKSLGKRGFFIVKPKANGLIRPQGVYATWNKHLALKTAFG